MLEGYKGGFEGVFGHEFVGEVIEINPGKAGQIAGGDGGKITVGGRVVGEINLPCGKCAICTRAAQATAAGVSASDQVVVAARNHLSLIHISEPTRHSLISYAVFCL